MKFCVCRVIGNFLFPRDSFEKKIKSLETVLEKDKEINDHKIWIINRIINKKFLKKVQSLLKNENYFYIPFEQNEFRKLKNENDKILYLTNINSARNFAIKKAWYDHDYAVSLDGDCFFENKKAWQGIKNEINNSNLNYFGLKMERIINTDKLETLKNQEPQVILKRSSELFNESLLFGNNEKVEFLNRIGIFKNKEKEWYETGQLCKFVGNVFHIGYDTKYELNLHDRMHARQQGLMNLLVQAENRIEII